MNKNIVWGAGFVLTAVIMGILFFGNFISDNIPTISFGNTRGSSVVAAIFITLLCLFYGIYLLFIEIFIKKR